MEWDMIKAAQAAVNTRAKNANCNKDAKAKK